MDIYHAFFDLKRGASDMAFARNLDVFLGRLRDDGRIASWRLTRRKLGLGPKQIGEFHLTIEVEDLAHLDGAFRLVATRAGDTEADHFAVNSMIETVTFALYRDFPDPERRTGEERF